jgi:hypothetical protein
METGERFVHDPSRSANPEIAFDKGRLGAGQWQLIVDGGGCNSSMAHGDADLGQPLHYIASSVEAGHGSLLVGIDGEGPVRIAVCAELGRQGRAGAQAERYIKGIEAIALTVRRVHS